MSKYKLIQLTNTNIPALAAGSFLPLGAITRRYNVPTCDCATFEVTNSGSDTLMITEPGYYKFSYNGTMTAGAAGNIAISLITNNNTVYTVSEEATAAEDVVNITLIYVIRVCPNCCSTPANCPATVQFKLGDTALGVTPNPSTGNLVIEKIG
jgi:hypothetical protein